MFSAINSLREIPRSGATFTVASWNFLVQLSSSAWGAGIPEERPGLAAWFRRPRWRARLRRL